VGTSRSSHEAPNKPSICHTTHTTHPRLRDADTATKGWRYLVSISFLSVDTRHRSERRLVLPAIRAHKE
jgi:hypothetical protein